MATRDFIDFDGSTSYATLTSALTHSGNFELELDFATTSATSQMLIGGTLAGTNELRLEIDASGFAKFYAYVGTTLQAAVTNAADLGDGKLHYLKATYTGTTAELFVDGTSAGTQTWALNGSQDVKLLGKISTGTFIDGTLANFASTDLVTSGNSVDFPLDTTASTESSTINTGTLTFTSTSAWTGNADGDNWLGDELAVNGEFGADTNWTRNVGWSISGGTANSTSTGDLRQTVLSTGNVFKSSIEVTSFTSGTFRVLDGSSGIIDSVTSARVSANTYISTGNNFNFTTAGGGFVGSVDHATVKRFLEDAYVVVAPEITDIDSDEIVLDAQVNATFTTANFTSEISTVQLVSGTSITTINPVSINSTSGAGDFDMPDVSAYTVDTVGCPFTSASNAVVARLTDA